MVYDWPVPPPATSAALASLKMTGGEASRTAEVVITSVSVSSLARGVWLPWRRDGVVFSSLQSVLCLSGSYLSAAPPQLARHSRATGARHSTLLLTLSVSPVDLNVRAGRQPSDAINTSQ